MGFQKRDFSSGKKFGGGGFQKRGFGGGSGSFGGGKRFGGDRFEKPEMYPATCGECGNRCEVPFRPNGRKPVLCTSCFKKDEGGFDAKPRFNDRPSRPSFGGNDNTAEQLRSINAKLEQIIKMLKADTTDDLSF